jgi:N,N'-diacetyllegionaminate synthase
MKVFILGGGITGLNTARELAKYNIESVVFEAKDRFGGLAGWHEAFGKKLDLGPHIYHTPDTEIQAYMEESLPNVFFKRDHWSKNYKDGEYHDYPISREFINSLPNCEQIYNEIERGKLESLSLHSNYRDYITALAGPTLRDLFFTVYPEKLWGVPTSELDANWAPKRIKIREKRLPFYGDQWAAVGKEGTYSIVSELVNQCSKANVNLRLNESVLSLSTENSHIFEIVTNKGTFDVGKNDIVLNTLSLTKSLPLVGKTPLVEYRGVTLVYIHINSVRALYEEFCDFVYIDDLDISFNRVSSQNTFVEKPDKTNVLCCEITYTKGDSWDLKTDKELVQIVLNDLVRCNFILESSFIDGEVVRIPEVYPMFKIGYREMMNRDISLISKFKNMHNLGSLAEFAYSDLQILFAKSRDFAELVGSRTQELNGYGYSRQSLFPVDELKIFDGIFKKGGMRTFLIAEIGINHNGDIQLGKELIDVAKNAGFDAVKFQTYKSEGRSAAKGKTSNYVEKVLDIEESDNSMFRKYELNYSQHEELFQYAKSRGIPFFSAPFDVESAIELDNLGVQAFKIASMELSNVDLIKRVASFGKPVILSSGMSSLSDIETALKICYSEDNYNIAVLHCTSIYPAPAESMNLNAIKTISDAFKIPVGLSDHFVGSTMSIAAKALGAVIIEKHVTLNKEMEGPDHVLSLDPIEQDNFVKAIRDLETAMESVGLKQPSVDEIRSELRFKKTIYAKKFIESGQVITSDDIELKAPAFGLKPSFRPVIVGAKASKDINHGDPITIDMIRNE